MAVIPNTPLEEPSDKMDSFKGPCPHQSVPVEMDERMTDMAWPPSSCEQCSGPAETSRRLQGHQQAQPRLPESHQEPRACHAAPTPHFAPPAASGLINPVQPVWPRPPREPLYEQDLLVHYGRGLAGPSDWGHSVEESVQLEPPLSLQSDVKPAHYVPSHYPPARLPGPYPMHGTRVRQCACCPPANLPRHNNNYYHYQRDYPADPCREPQRSWNPPINRPQLDAPNPHRGTGPQVAAPPRDVMHEVSVGRSQQAGPVPVTREIRKTISLSEEYRTLFITYSEDTAEEIMPFVTFLTDQGFKPAIDIFDNPIRRMGINKWMDSYLNDKSVLIIVVISPKYKEDVEGDGDEEHGLHTKYIHNQIQHEFIQQGCLNFRLVPVVFPTATKRHVPRWLQSTRIYHWPRDTNDLLLRLLREERYIIPQQGGDLTITVRPL